MANIIAQQPKFIRDDIAILVNEEQKPGSFGDLIKPELFIRNEMSRFELSPIPAFPRKRRKGLKPEEGAKTPSLARSAGEAWPVLRFLSKEGEGSLCLMNYLVKRSVELIGAHKEFQGSIVVPMMVLDKPIMQ